MSIEVKRIARTGALTILIVFGGLAIWSATAPLHGAIVVGGLVKVANNRKTVQHLEGGIVAEILVRDGDVVKHRGFLRPMDERVPSDPRVAAVIDGYAKQMAQQHQQSLLQDPLGAERLKEFQQSANDSIQEQQRLEANDQGSFEDYLARYYA